MRINTMDNLFVTELSDLYNAEKLIAKILPKMARQATEADLRAAFEDHLKETQGQIIRLDHVFALLDEKVLSDKCNALEGLVKETEDLMKHVTNRAVMDAALIAVAQKMEHYEIASYGTLCALGKTLGYTEIIALLHETLEEEKGADEKLTMIAKSGVNEKAERAIA